MDQQHFPAWTRSVRSVPSRRDVVRALAGAGLGLGALRLPDAGAACVVYGGICSEYCPATGGTACMPAGS